MKDKIKEILGRNGIYTSRKTYVYSSEEDARNDRELGVEEESLPVIKELVDYISSHYIAKERVKGLKMEEVKPYKYMATPTISADFSDIGGKKITAGVPFEAESSLTDEDIIRNSVIAEINKSIDLMVEDGK